LASKVWRVTIALRDVEPACWRTILVRPATKLAMLHRYVQAVMGWRDYHLWLFTIGDRKYGLPNPEWDFKVYDARRYTLERLFTALPAAFGYTYDFGDKWRHDIEIEREEDAAYRKQYPVCVDGDGACPPEDCGGPPGYERFRRVLDRPWHPEHAEMAAWADAQHYRPYFDTQLATWDLRAVRLGYR
jgi:Plasmid pRiA4b ORF-3-like protein